MHDGKVPHTLIQPRDSATPMHPALAIVTLLFRTFLSRRRAPLRRYTCECCGRAFNTQRTDDDALAEAVQRFGPIPAEDRAKVCGRCYAALLEMGPVTIS